MDITDIETFVDRKIKLQERNGNKIENKEEYKRVIREQAIQQNCLEENLKKSGGNQNERI